MHVAILSLFCIRQTTSNRTRGDHLPEGGTVMSRRLLYLAGCCALVAALASISFAQTTTVTTTQTQAVQNPDGTWTVIQYPTGKEAAVDFTPGTTFATAHGRAKIVRLAGGTKIALDLSGLPADASALHLYAVDPSAKVLWAVSPDDKYTKLGQVVNTGARNEAEIKSETTLSDFGLLVTLQPEGDAPAGDIVITGYMTP